jgi:hypothetical protein
MTLKFLGTFFLEKPTKTCKPALYQVFYKRVNRTYNKYVIYFVKNEKGKLIRIGIERFQRLI